MSDSNVFDNSLYKFDLTTGVWERVKTANSIPQLYASALMAYDNSLYLFSGFNSKLFAPSYDIYKLDLTSSNYVWTSLRIEDRTRKDIPKDTYTFSFRGSIAYILMGWNNNDLSNKVLTVDLNTIPLYFKAVTSEYISPPARKDHSLIVIGTKIYMFGGEGKSSK